MSKNFSKIHTWQGLRKHKKSIYLSPFFKKVYVLIYVPISALERIDQKSGEKIFMEENIYGREDKPFFKLTIW